MGRLILKTPKGTVDCGKDEMERRRQVLEKIVGVFRRHGGIELDTPIFEMKELLLRKYGEDEKLVYELKDQGGEICALRYDLTVPFARYLCANRIEKIRRYQIGKVFRRDQPSVAQGRMREFTQIDFDIAGNYEEMAADAEVLKIAHECYSAFLDEFVIKINHRGLLYGICSYAGIEEEKLKTVCSAIDKLDKTAAEAVHRELVAKGVSETSAEMLLSFRKVSGTFAEVAQSLLGKSAAIDAPVHELERLFAYCTAMGIEQHISIDLMLARGSDYYTGLIFEIVSAKHTGSIGGGGRYDRLIGDLCAGSSRARFDVPAVGFSVGLERLCVLLGSTSCKARAADVYVVSQENEALEQKFAVARMLWEQRVTCEVCIEKNKSFRTQLRAYEKTGIGLLCVLGGDESDREKVSLWQKGGKVKTLVYLRDLAEEIRAIRKREAENTYGEKGT